MILEGKKCDHFLFQGRSLRKLIHINLLQIQEITWTGRMMKSLKPLFWGKNIRDWKGRIVRNFPSNVFLLMGIPLVHFSFGLSLYQRKESNWPRIQIISHLTFCSRFVLLKDFATVLECLSQYVGSSSLRNKQVCVPKKIQFCLMTPVAHVLMILPLIYLIENDVWNLSLFEGPCHRFPWNSHFPLLISSFVSLSHYHLLIWQSWRNSLCICWKAIHHPRHHLTVCTTRCLYPSGNQGSFLLSEF